MDSDAIRRQERRWLWHPFTPMQEWESEEPLFIESGEGIKLRDGEGREYYDANSSLWVNLHGHRRREIDAASRLPFDAHERRIDQERSAQ